MATPIDNAIGQLSCYREMSDQHRDSAFFVLLLSLLQLCSILIALQLSFYPFDIHCCHTGSAIKYHVPDRVKPSFVIFDTRALI